MKNIFPDKMFVTRIRNAGGHFFRQTLGLSASTNKTTATRPTLKMSKAKHSSSIYADFNRKSRQAHPNVVAKVLNPGLSEAYCDGIFSSESFLPNGHLTVSAILTALDLCAEMYWRESGPLYLDVAELGSLAFITSLQLSCEPELYNCDIAKQPVKVVNELVLVGNTSFKTRVKLFLPEVNKPVAQKEMFTVLVDQNTRKPAAPPAWWRDKHLPYSRTGEKRIPPPPFDFSTWTGSKQQEDVYVLTMDVDANRHCHFTAFVRFCCEAYGRSQFRQFGHTSRGDPFRDVKSLVCAFKGEASLGDLLKVCFVQDVKDSDTYHFQIVNPQETVIFECCLTFFPQFHSKI